jgi:Enoyl-CoA hydratase/isomerase
LGAERLTIIIQKTCQLRMQNTEINCMIREHRAREPADVFHHSRAWHAAFSLLRHARIPAIAALHGATIGGGLELAAACHIRVADETAFFALPEGTRGIYVGGGASVHVARLLGAARMADMMLTGRVLDAAMAERAGLVQYLVPEGAAKSKAGELAAKVSAMAPFTILGVLEALPRIQDMSEADGLFVDPSRPAIMPPFVVNEDRRRSTPLPLRGCADRQSAHIRLAFPVFAPPRPHAPAGAGGCNPS